MAGSNACAVASNAPKSAARKRILFRCRMPSALFRLADNACRRAMIRNVRLGAAGAPVVVVRLKGNIKRRVPFVAVAEAAAARALAATVVVRDGVVLAIRRVLTGADPRDHRHFGSR